MLTMSFSTDDPGDENDYGAPRRGPSVELAFPTASAQAFNDGPHGAILARDPGDEDDNPAYALD